MDVYRKSVHFPGFNYTMFTSVKREIKFIRQHGYKVISDKSKQCVYRQKGKKQLGVTISFGIEGEEAREGSRG